MIERLGCDLPGEIDDKCVVHSNEVFDLDEPPRIVRVSEVVEFEDGILVDGLYACIGAYSSTAKRF